jgi:hypothetical protein
MQSFLRGEAGDGAEGKNKTSERMCDAAVVQSLHVERVQGVETRLRLAQKRIIQRSFPILHLLLMKPLHGPRFHGRLLPAVYAYGVQQLHALPIILASARVNAKERRCLECVVVQPLRSELIALRCVRIDERAVVVPDGLVGANGRRGRRLGNSSQGRRQRQDRDLGRDPGFSLWVDTQMRMRTPRCAP